MSRYLIAISMGPVQEFIAAARKTADLYAGSQLLLDVVGAAASEFPAEERIFPASVAKGGANKILAEVTGNPAQHVENAKQRAKKCLLEQWNKSTKQKNISGIDQAKATAQLEHFLEFYAAWTPIPDGNDGYPQARKRVEQLLSGRKALRDFSTLDQDDEGIPKSPLDPALASILTLENGKVLPKLQEKLNCKEYEVLDAISLLKRLKGKILSQETLRTNELAQRAFESDYRSENEEEKPKQGYFAVLLADGDNMGKALDKRNTASQHFEFSKQLDEFAAKAEEIIRKYNGMPIYSGGDDVLALLPVTTVLACGQDLETAFKHIVREKLSAGIAIVHYREPLNVSLQHVRFAEKVAKKIEGKDSVCITLHTRGGSPVKVAQKWDTTQVIQDFQAIDFPRGLPYELLELAREWPDDFEIDTLNAEVQRIAKRKRDQDGEKSDVSEKLPEIQEVAQLELLAKQLIIARFLNGKGDRK